MTEPQSMLELADEERIAMWHVINYLRDQIKHQNPKHSRADLNLRLEKWLVEAVIKCLVIARSTAAAQPVAIIDEQIAIGQLNRDWNNARSAAIEECINARVLLTNLGGRSDDWIRGFDAGTNAFIDALEKLRAAPSPLSAPGEATVSEFTNELGNTIRITIEGPTSKSTNDLTPRETVELNKVLTRHFAPGEVAGGGDSSDVEAIALTMNILQRLADTATSALHGDLDPDATLCEINNLARDTIDALAKRRVDISINPATLSPGGGTGTASDGVREALAPSERHLAVSWLRRFQNADFLSEDECFELERVVAALSAPPAAQPCGVLVRRIELARSFIAAEYADPAQEPKGDWIAPEARPAHDALCLCLEALGAHSHSRPYSNTAAD